MKNSQSTNSKFRKKVYEFLMMVFQLTGAMAILFPILFLLASIPLQFSPQNYETAMAIRTLRGIILFTGSGAIGGFLIGCGIGFVVHILPAIHELKKVKNDDDIEEIAQTTK